MPPFIGEIRMFAGNFAPAGWAFCDGQILAIAENDALFTLIGTTYGGDGQTTFALPDLRGRIPIHQGTGSGLSTHVVGEAGGVETVTLTVQQLPVHTHPLLASLSPGTSTNPATNVLAAPPSNLYIQDVASVSMRAQAIASAGGSQPHENVMPFLCVTFIISLFGVFPSQT